MNDIKTESRTKALTYDVKHIDSLCQFTPSMCAVDLVDIHWVST